MKKRETQSPFLFVSSLELDVGGDPEGASWQGGACNRLSALEIRIHPGWCAVDIDLAVLAEVLVEQVVNVRIQADVFGHLVGATQVEQRIALDVAHRVIDSAVGC